jgi:hypothetical protein
MKIFYLAVYWKVTTAFRARARSDADGRHVARMQKGMVLTKEDLRPYSSVALHYLSRVTIVELGERNHRVHRAKMQRSWLLV